MDQPLYSSPRAPANLLRIAFWRAAREICLPAFEDLAAIPVPPAIKESWIEYFKGGFAVAPHRDFEAALIEWARRHRVHTGWVVELARASRLAWEVGSREHLDAEPPFRLQRNPGASLLAPGGAAGLDSTRDMRKSGSVKGRRWPEILVPRPRLSGRMPGKARRNLERDLCWTARAAVLGESWQAIARRRSPHVSADVVRKAVERIAAEIGLEVPAKRTGRPKRRSRA